MAGDPSSAIETTRRPRGLGRTSRAPRSAPSGPSRESRRRFRDSSGKSRRYTSSFVSDDGRRRHHASTLHRREDEPLRLVLCRVGTTLLVFCALTYAVYWANATLFRGVVVKEEDAYAPNVGGQRVEHDGRDKGGSDVVERTVRTTTPPWDVDSSTLAPLPATDEGGVVDAADPFARLRKRVDDASTTNAAFWADARAATGRAAAAYGGEDAASWLLRRAVRPTSSSGLDDLAARLAEVGREGRPLRVGFTGYGPTTGRGNRRARSFPFTLETILTEPVRTSLGVDVEVINVGMANVSPFPYGWCLNEILSHDDVEDDATAPVVDVLGIDFSRNEKGFEAFLRNVAALRGNPVIILRDMFPADGGKKFKQRQKIFLSYVDQGFLPPSSFTFYSLSGGVVLKPFLDLEHQSRPPGFQNWHEYDAPRNSRVERSRHDPTAQEHDLMAWLLGLHFLAALEIVADGKVDATAAVRRNVVDDDGGVVLPPPKTNLTDPAPYHALSYGSPTEESFAVDGEDRWTMPSSARRCYTTFASRNVTDGGGAVHHLSDLVESGVAGTDVDVRLPKGPMIYHKGWALDAMDTEKVLKHKEDVSLGYVDGKMGYFGVPPSGPLRLFLPLTTTTAAVTAAATTTAKSLLRPSDPSLTVCGINESRGHDACEMIRDLEFVVGGAVATDVAYVGGEEASWLGKELCVSVPVPEEAVAEMRDDERTAKKEGEGRRRSAVADEEKKRGGDAAARDGRVVVGLRVEIRVVNKKVTLKSGPCSISHVIWEQA